jgi:hypothetical protein
MIKFLIQTYNKKVTHDFSFTLIESIRYQNWLCSVTSQMMKCEFTDGKTKPNCIPIGSNDFVIEYLQKYYNKSPKPKNIPQELLSENWTGRTVFNGTEKDIQGEMFVKSNDKIKHFTEICSEAPKGNYQISSLIEIQSEWRAFVYNQELVGLQNYAGAFDIFPNVEKIKAMIKAYKSQPIAFTLDVAIIDNFKIADNFNTVVIEVHDFFSCGLYGFANHGKLPYMFSKWFYQYINS